MLVRTHGLFRRGITTTLGSELRFEDGMAGFEEQTEFLQGCADGGEPLVGCCWSLLRASFVVMVLSGVLQTA